MSRESANEHDRLERDAKRAEQRPGYFAAMGFYRDRARQQLATDGWRTDCERSPFAVRTASLESTCRVIGQAVDVLPSAALLSFARRAVELEYELAEVIASLSRRTHPPKRTPEQIDRVIDAIMGGY